MRERWAWREGGGTIRGGEVCEDGGGEGGCARMKICNENGRKGSGKEIDVKAEEEQRKKD